MAVPDKYYRLEKEADKALANWTNYYFSRYADLIYIAVIPSDYKEFNFELEFGWKTPEGGLRLEDLPQISSEEEYYTGDYKPYNSAFIPSFIGIEKGQLDKVFDPVIDANRPLIKTTSVFTSEISTAPVYLEDISATAVPGSVGTEKLDMGGSLGGFFKLKNKKGTFGITNWHVIKSKNGFLGEHVYSPRLAGLLIYQTNIKELRKIGKLVWGKLNRKMDAAIFRVTEENRLNDLVQDHVIEGIDTPELNQCVWKMGMSSQHSTGTLRSRNVSIRLNVPGRGKFVFKKQLQISKMSEGGDSGSLLMNQKNYVLGLLFASHETDNQYSYANNINNIFNQDFRSEHFFLEADDTISILDQLELDSFINKTK